VVRWFVRLQIDLAVCRSSGSFKVKEAVPALG
jgi:hypothetical protein